MAASTSRDDGKSQLDKFKGAARDLECDDNEATFEARLRKLAAHKSKKTAE